mmetsp:Transcript_47370/g.62681  ORF Transcript_47370/g.62681 Transcript_47370/m.62681 type:complete len:104 (+) Transcript_47370:799-1110(+)
MLLGNQAEEVIASLLKLLILESVLLNRLEVNKERPEATIPVVHLARILRLFRLFDFVVQLLESDYIAEQILEPGCEDVSPCIELLVFAQSPHIYLEGAAEAVS